MSILDESELINNNDIELYHIILNAIKQRWQSLDKNYNSIKRLNVNIDDIVNDFLMIENSTISIKRYKNENYWDYFRSQTYNFIIQLLIFSNEYLPIQDYIIKRIDEINSFDDLARNKTIRNKDNYDIFIKDNNNIVKRTISLSVEEVGTIHIPTANLLNLEELSKLHIKHINTLSLNFANRITSDLLNQINKSIKNFLTASEVDQINIYLSDMYFNCGEKLSLSNLGLDDYTQKFLEGIKGLHTKSLNFNINEAFILTSNTNTNTDAEHKLRYLFDRLLKINNTYENINICIS